MRQSGILAAAGLHGLAHNRQRLPTDHEHARRLAAAFDRMDGLAAARPETNIVLVDVVDEGLNVGRLLSFLHKHRILMLKFGRSRLRAVTHGDVTAEGIARTITTLGEFEVPGSTAVDVA